MKKKIAALAAAIGSVVTAIMGSQLYGTNNWVTYIATGGLTLVVVLDLFTTENLSQDLRNGRFADLLKEAIKKLEEEQNQAANNTREEDNPNG